MDGYWAPSVECKNAGLCDSSEPSSVSDRCKPPVVDCLGRDPGTILCIGDARVRCGPDLVTVETLATCASQTLCLLGTDEQCAVCVDEEYRCSGATLERCAADHASFVEVETCQTEAGCNAGAGACTSDVCVSGQHRCSGNTLERCNANADGFTPVQTCDSGLCDAMGAECDVCIPGTTSCKSSTESQRCNPDGQSYTSVACPADTPTCTGQGVCTCVSEPASVTCEGKCGSVPDNCGRAVACGGCTPPEVCSGGGTANVCGVASAELCGLCSNHPDCPPIEPVILEACDDIISNCYYDCDGVDGQVRYNCLNSTWLRYARGQCPLQ